MRNPRSRFCVDFICLNSLLKHPCDSADVVALADESDLIGKMRPLARASSACPGTRVQVRTGGLPPSSMSISLFTECDRMTGLALRMRIAVGFDVEAEFCRSSQAAAHLL